MSGCGNVASNYDVPAHQALPDRYALAGLADPTPGRLEAGREKAGLAAEQVHLDAAAHAVAALPGLHQQRSPGGVAYLGGRSDRPDHAARR